MQQQSMTGSQSQAFFFRQKQKNGHLDIQGSVFKLRLGHVPSSIDFPLFSFHSLPLGTSNEVLEPVCTSSQQVIVKCLQNSLIVNLGHYYTLKNINLQPDELYLRCLKMYHFVIILLNAMIICALEVCCSSYRCRVR